MRGLERFRLLGFGSFVRDLFILQFVHDQVQLELDSLIDGRHRVIQRHDHLLEG